MTDQELRNLVSEIAVSVKELREAQKQTDEQLRQTASELRESQKQTDEQLRQTSSELRLSIQELRESQKQTDEQLRQIASELRETQRQTADDLRALRKETDRQIKQANKQLGEIGRKMGAYTEGMAEQSLEKIFNNKFKLEFAATNVRRSRNGKSIELDMLGYSNSKQNVVVVAEIKSSFAEEDFEQVLNTLVEFPKFFPEHADKQLFGIVAAVNIPSNMRHKLWKNGIYLAILGDEVFRMTVPENFRPKQYNPNLGLAE